MKEVVNEELLEEVNGEVNMDAYQICSLIRLPLRSMVLILKSMPGR